MKLNGLFPAILSGLLAGVPAVGIAHAAELFESGASVETDSLHVAQFRARQRMQAQALVGETPVLSDSARSDSMPGAVIAADEHLSAAELEGYQAADSNPFDPNPYASPAISSPPPGMFGEGRLALALVDDFEMGLRLGAQLADPGLPLDLFLDFEGRPFSKAIRRVESAILEYQYQEHRFTPSLGLASRLPLGSTGDAFWTFGGGAGISFGYYRGSDRGAEVTFPIWAETGFRFKLSEGRYLGFGYQYFPLPSASSHRVTVVLGMRGPDRREP